MNEIKEVIQEIIEKRCYDIPDFIWNLLELKNISNSPLNFYYEFIRDYCNLIDGEIVEFGVYRGASLLSTAILLKSYGSEKRIYGFDSFSGFPSFHENDDRKKFGKLFDEGKITEEHYRWVNFKTACEKILPREHHFDNTSINFINERITTFELDNIIIIQGDLTEKMDELPKKIMATLYDCDLYLPYAKTLPTVYEKTVSGGLIYLDEYYSLKYPGPRIAVDDFCRKIGISPVKSHLHSQGGFERWYINKV